MTAGFPVQEKIPKGFNPVFLVVILAGICLLLSFRDLQAQTYPQHDATKPGYVDDFAGVLDAGTTAQLRALTKDLDAKSSVEMAVVVIKSSKPLPLKDYAVELFRRWGIGKKEKNNGVLLILASQDRRGEIEVGYGLEGVLTDGKCGEILDRNVVPYFKSGNWPAGLLAGAQAIAATVQGERVAQEPPPPHRENHSAGLSNEARFKLDFFLIGGAWVFMLIVARIVSNPLGKALSIGFTLVLAIMLGMTSFFALNPFLALLFVAALIWGYWHYFNRPPPCPKCRSRKEVSCTSSREVVAPTYSHSGIQETKYHCTSCNHDWTVRETIAQKVRASSSGSGSSWSSGSSSWDSSSSSGSSFGGGSSGGGGAGRSF